MGIKRRWGASALILALALAGCGNNEIDHSIQTGTSDTSEPRSGGGTGTGSGTGDGTGSDASPAATAATDTAQTTGTSGGSGQDPTSNVLTLSISNNPNEPLYSQGVMQVPVNTKFVVNYDNPSQQPHNWVLVQPGKEQAVADAAEAKNGDPSGIEGVIAWTPPITGQSTTIEVPALPEAGGYPYICTVPGHYEAGHKGALNVR